MGLTDTCANIEFPSETTTLQRKNAQKKKSRTKTKLSAKLENFVDWLVPNRLFLR